MAKATKNPQTNAYAQIGMSAMLPGMVHMVELMAAEVEKFRAHLAALQEQPEAAEQEEEVSEARGRSGWPADPEERSAEMARRQKVAKQRKAKAQKPDGRASSWAGLSPAKKKKRLALMLAGRKKTPKLEQVA